MDLVQELDRITEEGKKDNTVGLTRATCRQIDRVSWCLYAVYIRDLLHEAYDGQELLTLGLNSLSQFE